MLQALNMRLFVLTETIFTLKKDYLIEWISPSRLRHLRTLRALLTRLSPSNPLPTMRTWFVHLKSFKDGFSVHQKVPIFQRLLKTWQTVSIFMLLKKKSHESFYVRKFSNYIRKVKSVQCFCVFLFISWSIK